MATYTIKSKGELRKQRFILLSVLILSSFSALIFDIISAANGGVATHFDIAPTSFSLSLVLLVVATFKYSFLDIVPVTIKKIFYELKDPVIIFNKQNKAVICNTSFENLFQHDKKISNVTDLIECLTKYGTNNQQNASFLSALNGKENLPFSKEIRVKIRNTNREGIFDANILPVINSSGKETGRIVSFCDITLYKELAAEKERSRIALELHDSIGYGLVNLIMLLKEAKVSLTNNPLMIKEKMSNILNISEKMLKDLRFSVMELKSGTNPDVVSIIDSFADYVRCMGIAVEISVIGQDQYKLLKSKASFMPISDTLYKVCREAVTNSLRHGKATKITIIMKFSINSVKMFIIDDGLGCIEVKKGIGLTGMETRVKEIGGFISYGSHDGNGFNINIEIPLEIGENDESISC